MVASGTPAVIAASWRRCEQDYSLDPHGVFRQQRLTEQEVRHSRERIFEQIGSTPSAMDRMREIARDVGYCVLFADAEGVVVRDFCDSEHARSLRDSGLAPGTVWQESAVGTNGIGTALVERRSITVNCADHFHDRLKQFVCISAPLFDPEGATIGVLDVSGGMGDRRSESVLLHQLIEESAAWIQAALFRHRFRDHFLVGLSHAPDVNNQVFQSLVAVDDNGLLAGVSENALRLFGARREDLARKPVSELLGTSIQALESGIGRVQRLEGRPGTPQYAFSFPRSDHQTRGRAQAIPVRMPHRPPGPAAGDVMGLDHLAGGDTQMRRNAALARRVADADLPILLQGETGTGKEVFARAIHQYSQRRQRPFVAVNCAAVPDTLLDSELFGYEPGTFTGGLKGGKTGKVVASSGGTLFLDEIGDMPLDLQTRLLRVLSEREVTPLGAVDPIPVDLRLVCATHRDLRKMVDSGKFREDLYYRIHGARIVLPPLRLRDDLPDLIEAVARAAAGEVPLSFGADAFDCMVNYPWPGNIRQLSNVVRLLALTCEDARVSLDDLPDEIRHAMPDAASDTDLLAAPPRMVSVPNLRQAMDEIERVRILEVLQGCKWRVAKAARRLGISRATMHRRMKDYSLLRPTGP